jgi:ectoine hydroxylase-related dioxygenase (phytanoyl-CoA dioxygenase family)
MSDLLTEQDVRRFQVFGFVVLRQWITQDEVAAIRRDVSVAMERAYRHRPFDGSRRHWLPMTGAASPTIAGFLEDARFFDASERLLGSPVVPLLADANRYTGDTGWHCDTGDRNQGTRFLLHLQPVDASTGGLRLMPGSHRQPLHDEVETLRRDGLLDDGSSVPAYAAAVEPGDAIVFNWPTFHAAYGGRSDRQMCTVNFFSLAEGAERIRGQLRANVAMHERAWGWRDGFPYWDPEWFENVDGSPRRQVLIDRIRDLDLRAAVAAGKADALRPT